MFFFSRGTVELYIFVRLFVHVKKKRQGVCRSKRRSSFASVALNLNVQWKQHRGGRRKRGDLIWRAFDLDDRKNQSLALLQIFCKQNRAIRVFISPLQFFDLWSEARKERKTTTKKWPEFDFKTKKNPLTLLCVRFLFRRRRFRSFSLVGEFFFAVVCHQAICFGSPLSTDFVSFSRHL